MNVVLKRELADYQTAVDQYKRNVRGYQGDIKTYNTEVADTNAGKRDVTLPMRHLYRRGQEVYIGDAWRYNFEVNPADFGYAGWGQHPQAGGPKGVYAVRPTLTNPLPVAPGQPTGNPDPTVADQRASTGDYAYQNLAAERGLLGGVMASGGGAR